jgi:hypothetical protein
MRQRSLAAVSIFALTCAAAPSPATTASRGAEIRSQPPGEGVLCGWAFMIVAREVGRQCFAGQDADFQAVLQDSVSRIDAYAARNGPFTPAQVADFHKRMGKERSPPSDLCQGDLRKVYEGYRSAGQAALRTMTDVMVSRAGRPTWGTCT